MDIPTTLTVVTSIVHNMEAQCKMRKTGTIHAQRGSGANLGSNLQLREGVHTQLINFAKCGTRLTIWNTMGSAGDRATVSQFRLTQLARVTIWKQWEVRVTTERSHNSA